MTLEDFFTLTEMKDGISNVARIEELVCEIQKLRDSVGSDMGDSLRQWTAVAGTLASTENMECLRHFIQLNGLCFLNQWLQEAQKCNNDVSNNVADELINVILASLERLPVDNEQSTYSGIGDTVEQLLAHGKINIKEKARMLYDRWGHVKEDVSTCHEVDKVGTCQINQLKPPEIAQTAEEEICPGNLVSDSECIGGCGELNEIEPVKAESNSSVTRCSDSVELDSSNNAKVSISKQILSLKSSNFNLGNAVLGDVNSSQSSLVSTAFQENLSVAEESSACIGVTMVTSCPSSSKYSEVKIDNQRDVLVKDVSAGVEDMEVDKLDSNPGVIGEREKCDKEQTVSLNLDYKNNVSSASEILEPQLESSERTKEFKQLAHVTQGFQDLSDEASILRKKDGPATTSQRNKTAVFLGDIKDNKGETKLKEVKGMESVNLVNCSKALESKATVPVEEKLKGVSEYDDMDALEVARQVAIEVEREVVDYREALCSSPEVNSGDTRDASCPGSEEPKQYQANIEVNNGNRSPDVKEYTGSASSLKEESSGITENVSSGSVKHERDSNLTSCAQESGSRSDRAVCEFDLNTNYCAEEPDCSVKPIADVPSNMSTPILVAASKGAPVIPVTPLHFEGEFGWKGSAATSAFRPASPRITLSGEKPLIAPKEKPNFLEFDLNVAESEDDLVVEPVPAKVLPTSSDIPYGVSSVEVISREGKLELDLNRLGDEDAPSCPSFWKPHRQSGEQSLSSASSSSSRQHALRDFDLNDNPSVLDGGSSHDIDQSSYKAFDMHGGAKINNSAFAIMGSRIMIESKDFPNQMQQGFLFNGISNEARGAARPMLPYAHMPPPGYGYTGLASGSAMPIPPAIYGPGSFPYMIDSRGTPVIPQIMGRGLNSPLSVRPSSSTNARSASPSNEFASFRPGLDLNSGMVSMEGGNRERGNFRQFFLQDHNGLIADHVRTMPQPSSPGMPFKRKEPDSGWEPYQYSYKHMTQ
ncbi:uncharacterized protein [Typha angustifolia]|uniref:uncharacterized protein n=1 Tax=Typha angustifolia TaxID=59011 RepID=UPI003C2FACE7